MKNKEKIEIMKYKRNSLSYSLILIGLFFNIIYFIKLYQENDLYFYNISMGISVIYNLMFMLFVFLSAENIKVYSIFYSLFSIFIGILQIIRIGFIPKKAFDNNIINSEDFKFLAAFLLLSSIFLILGGIISVIKSYKLKRFLREEKNGIT